MNANKIIELTRKIWLNQDELSESQMEKIVEYGKLIAKSERDECVKLFVHDDLQYVGSGSKNSEAYGNGWIEGITAYQEILRNKQ